MASHVAQHSAELDESLRQLQVTLVAPPPSPLPPANLIRLINRSGKADPQVFQSTGRASLLAILQALIQFQCSLADCQKVFEFGCGLGRMLVHWQRTDLDLTGCDMNPTVQKWCRDHLSGMTFHLNGAEPPLGFAEDGAFDFVYANSVFTHIPLKMQQAWLQELKRVVRPGGLIALTVLGRHHREVMLNADQREVLQSKGTLELNPIYHLPQHGPLGPLGNWVSKLNLRKRDPISYRAVFQTPERLRASFEAVFDWVGRREETNSQDVVVLRRG